MFLVASSVAMIKMKTHIYTHRHDKTHSKYLSQWRRENKAALLGDHPHTGGVCWEKGMKGRWEEEEEEDAIAAAAGRLWSGSNVTKLHDVRGGLWTDLFRLGPRILDRSVTTSDQHGCFVAAGEKMWSHGAEPKQVERDRWPCFDGGQWEKVSANLG